MMRARRTLVVVVVVAVGLLAGASEAFKVAGCSAGDVKIPGSTSLGRPRAAQTSASAYIIHASFSGPQPRRLGKIKCFSMHQPGKPHWLTRLDIANANNNVGLANYPILRSSKCEVLFACLLTDRPPYLVLPRFCSCSCSCISVFSQDNHTSYWCILFLRRGSSSSGQELMLSIACSGH